LPKGFFGGFERAGRFWNHEDKATIYYCTALMESRSVPTRKESQEDKIDEVSGACRKRKRKPLISVNWSSFDSR
jgi:hypothetical protein